MSFDVSICTSFLPCSSLSLSLSLSPPSLPHLTAIASFLKFCSDLISPEVTRRLMLPLDSALAMLSGYAGLDIEFPQKYLWISSI